MPARSLCTKITSLTSHQLAKTKVAGIWWYKAKNIMENVKELLQKLDRFAVVANKENGKKTIHLENGLEVNYRVEVHPRYGDLFQVYMWVKKDGVSGTSWGCADMDENRAVVEWFVQKEVIAYEMESAKRKKTEADIKRLLS